MVQADDDVGNTGAPLLEHQRASDTSSIHTSPYRTGGGHDDGPRRLTPQGLGTWFIWALTLSAGISGLLFGYDTGVISSTLVSVGSDLSRRELTTLDKSLITSSTSLFALISSPIAGVLGDKLGRRPVIVIADILFILGALMQSVTSAVWGMIFGRSLIGLAVGMASLITPLYVSELSPSHLRGRMVIILSLFITGGQVVAYVVGWLLSTTHGGWRWMVGLGAAPAIIQLLILLFLPETPRWLVRVDRVNEARRIMCRVYSDSDSVAVNHVVEQILQDIEDEINSETEGNRHLKPTGKWLNMIPRNCADLLFIRSNRRALVIACMLQAFQQLSGFNSILYFSATIFQLLSFSVPTLTSLSVAITNFLFTFLAFSLIDRIGRRRILLLSIPIMTAALLVCAILFSFIDITHPSGDSNSSGLLPFFILFSLTIFTASYASGIGTVPWQQAELFPLKVRSLGSAVATATNWGSNFLIGLTFLPMMEWLSAGWAFFIYTIICGVSWIAVWAIYPEMSGLELEDVRGLLSDGWGVEESLERFAAKQRST